MTVNYLARLSPRQAVRYSRFFYNDWKIRAAPLRVSRPDLSEYEEKSQELLEQLVDTVISVADQWEKFLKDSLRRLEQEDSSR